MRPRITTAVAALLLGACATSPLGRNQIILVSEEQMSQMGVAAYQDLKQKNPRTKNPRAAAYVQCIADAVVREVGGSQAWEVTTFEDDAVNAFALPGGKIGVFTGLLKVAETPDQLAAVIGHEIAHVLARHGAERVSEQMVAQVGMEVASSSTGINPQMLGLATNVFFLLPHSRNQESEADLVGLDLMARAGFDPGAAVTLWQNMAKASGGKPPEFLSTHPSSDTRIAGIQKRLPKAMPLYEQARAAGRRPACQPV